MNHELRGPRSRFRRPELEKMGFTVEALRKLRSVNLSLRQLDLDTCAVKTFVGKRDS
ncbi:MAG: hypothetical protein JW844_06930 [Candidatus Omnitrophica bacterium]|nr:hypothetical protein [Candidatus Omnitrophota bacterium]